MKRLGAVLFPLDGMLVHRGITLTNIKFTGTHLLSWAEKDTPELSVWPKNTTQCPQPGLELGLLFL